MTPPSGMIGALGTEKDTSHSAGTSRKYDDKETKETGQ